MSNNNQRSGGISLMSGMFLLFLGLKLGKVIDWSWWWVTAPLWGGAALILLIVVILAILMIIGKI
jgi:uncharacterized membrane protein